MRAMFGIVSLLIVVVIVGLLASRQMKAVTSVPITAGNAASTPAANARQQSQQLQEQVRGDVARALEQGATRREESDK